jgi:hypothetical protein
VKTGPAIAMAGKWEFAGTYCAAGEADRVCGKEGARPRLGVRGHRRQCDAALRLRQSVGAMASHFGINLYAAGFPRFLWEIRQLSSAAAGKLLGGDASKMGGSGAGRSPSGRLAPVSG